MGTTKPMFVFAVSDKGGTGRSVTACNIAYRLAEKGRHVAYLDFDFGSPTAGAIFEIAQAERGVKRGGLHSYLTGSVQMPVHLDVRSTTTRGDLQKKSLNAGRLVLFPGDEGGAEFIASAWEHMTRSRILFQQLSTEFEVCVVDLSAGRSLALQIVLHATAHPAFRKMAVRWLVFHRWTRQHLRAARSLVFELNGLVDGGVRFGHEREAILESIRFVRTAVPALDEDESAGRAEQSQWLQTCDEELTHLASRLSLGHTWTLGRTPMEPMLQWQEQIILDSDVTAKIANEQTVQAFCDLAQKLCEPGWGEQ